MGRRRPSVGDAPLSSPSAQGGGTTPHWAESVTADYLGSLGWRPLARNYRLRGGELDIVCLDDSGLVVFVEVKQRSSNSHGGAAESMDARKLQRLRRTAAHFLAFEMRRPEAPARFDAVLITGSSERYDLQHLRDIA